jgi:hypothetical protein
VLTRPVNTGNTDNSGTPGAILTNAPGEIASPAKPG